jgi:hypothetical protein
MAVKEAEEKQKTTALAKQASAGLPAEFAEELAADAGAGTSQNADDNIVPFIVLLQDMSPQVKKRDAEYVDGAEPGMLMNKATKKLYASDDAQATANHLPLLVFQPCAFDRAIIQWIPRVDGGGFVARHDLKGTVEETMKAIGAKQVEITDEKGDKKLVWKTGDGKHDLIDTRYHFGNILEDDGTIVPAVIGMSSTGHTASREWMTLMNQKVKVGEKLITPPSWSKSYIVHSKGKTNNKGDFFVFTVDDNGWVQDAALRAAGKELNAAFGKGDVKANDADLNDGAAAGAGAADAEMPI